MPMTAAEFGEAVGEAIAPGDAALKAELAALWSGETLTTDGLSLRVSQLLATYQGRMLFGPVASVQRAKDYDEALALANDTIFGLSSGICTTSLKYASHFKRNSEAGMVMVNLPTAGVDYHVPFGGRKGSSYGAREQGAYAREFYTSVKTAYIYPV